MKHCWFGYAWHPPHLCLWNLRFTVEHALSFPERGFLSVRHNGIYDITADLLSEACYSFGADSVLQPAIQELHAYLSS